MRVPWPLLRERVHPVLAIRHAHEGVDMLHDAALLVVGLFHQKAAVLDGAVRSRFRRWLLRVCADGCRDSAIAGVGVFRPTRERDRKQEYEKDDGITTGHRV